MGCLKLSYNKPGSSLKVAYRNPENIKNQDGNYYPFGLQMAGISSKAAGGLENKKKYNGIEFNSDFDINMYDAFYRNLDPQIGRFWQIDPKIESAEAWSPYSAMLDNPIRYMDPLGDSGINPIFALVLQNHHAGKGLSTMELNRKNVLKPQTSVDYNEGTLLSGAGGTIAKNWPGVSDNTIAVDNTTSLSETVTKYSNTISDDGKNKFLISTTKTITTTVDFNMDQVSNVNVSIATSTGSTKITSDDPKNNSITISLNSGMVLSSDVKSYNVSTNLSDVSPELKAQVKAATDKNANIKNKVTPEMTTDGLQNLIRPIIR